MKKISILIIALLACIQLVKAQSYNKTHFSVNVGINGSQITDNNDRSTDGVAGLNAGIAVDQYFSRNWSLNVGLNYQQKGYGNGFVVFDDGTELDGVDYRLNYLTVPVLASLHFGYHRNWYVNFGPYVGFLLSASESSNSVFNAKSYFNTVDGGLAFNVGVKLPINRQTKFFIEAGGQGGVVNVYKDSDYSLQNVTTSLNVGIEF